MLTNDRNKYINKFVRKEYRLSMRTHDVQTFEVSEGLLFVEIQCGNSDVNAVASVEP